MDSFQKGDIVTFERDVMGSPSGGHDTYILTGLILSHEPNANGMLEVEYTNPVPYMSGLTSEPEEPLHFGDTNSFLDPDDVISHYRPSEE